MQVEQIIAELEGEIKRLQEARALLAGEPSRRGRPRGSVNTPKGTAAKPGGSAAKPRRKRNLSAEGRQRIAEAMRRRWADRKKAQSA